MCSHSGKSKDWSTETLYSTNTLTRAYSAHPLTQPEVFYSFSNFCLIFLKQFRLDWTSFSQPSLSDSLR